MKPASQNSALWFVYIASLLTPFTCLLSGVIGIIYAGYRLDKNEDGEVANSHYYGLIRSFFLFLTFFVVLLVTVATSNGLIIGVKPVLVCSFMVKYRGLCYSVYRCVHRTVCHRNLDRTNGAGDESVKKRHSSQTIQRSQPLITHPV